MATDRRRARPARWSGPVLLVLLLATRAPLEATMWRHMLVQLPLLVACGVLLRPWPCRLLPLAPGAARWDAQGLATLTAAAFAMTYWMIPRALEQALDEPFANGMKFISLLLLGACCPAPCDAPTSWSSCSLLPISAP